MERFRATSPESGIPAFSWRKTPRPRGSVLDKISLTSSLPLPAVFSKERERKSPKNMTPQFSNNEVVSKEGLPHQIIERPRSASLQMSPAQLQVIKKKPLRNFTRAHSSSARFGRIRLDSARDSSSESTSVTCEVDDALASIRTQLAQLSEEDVLLQERLDRLTLGIASIQRCVDGKCCLSSAVAPTTTFISYGKGGILRSPNLSSSRASLLMLSPSQSNILAIAEESWEDEEKDWEGSKKDGGKGISNYLNLSNSARGSCEQSLGSCESLTYSNGSLSLGQPSRYSVVVNRPPNVSLRRFSCEDDVFFA